MKKYLLLITLSFFIISPAFAFETGTQFAVSFCMTENASQTFVEYNCTFETYNSDGCPGGGIIAGYYYDTNSTPYLASGMDNGDIIGTTQTGGEHQFLVNYQDGAICLYVDGTQAGNCESESTLDSKTMTLLTTPANVTQLREYATALTPTEIQNLSCNATPETPETLTATSTLANITGVIINTTMEFLTVVFTQYFPYALILMILSALAGAFLAFVLKPLKVKR